MSITKSTVINDTYNLTEGNTRKIQIEENKWIVVTYCSSAVARIFLTDNAGTKIPIPAEMSALDVTHNVTQKSIENEYQFCWTDAYFIYYKRKPVLRLLPQRQWVLMSDVEIECSV
jgi:hypothetical protein